MKDKYMIILWDYMIDKFSILSIKNNNLHQNGNSDDLENGKKVNRMSNNQMENKIKNVKEYLLIFPIVYFLTSITILFYLVLMNIFKEKFNTKQEIYPLHHFPIFFNLTSIHSNLYLIAVMIISLSGIINVWFFCSMVLQRFSVPELRTKKIYVHFMFILGIFANIIYIFMGFSPEILKIESIKFRNLKLSLSLIVFLLFIIFNIIFSFMSTWSIECIDNNTSNKRIVKKRQVKKFVLYLAIFSMFIYIIAVILQTNGAAKFIKGIQKIILNLILVIGPYALFILNAFMNLSLYSDLVFIREIMSQIMEKDYFSFEEEPEMEHLIS